jgi:Zn finger protein HypA/HybF involved in hydrogenase expression
MRHIIDCTRCGKPFEKKTVETLCEECVKSHVVPVLKKVENVPGKAKKSAKK